MARGKVDSSKIRVIAVYNLIKRGGRVSCADILRHLESKYDIVADRKTIIKDMQSINMILPVISFQGRNGGYEMFAPYGGDE